MACPAHGGVPEITAINETADRVVSEALRTDLNGVAHADLERVVTYAFLEHVVELGHVGVHVGEGNHGEVVGSELKEVLGGGLL